MRLFYKSLANKKKLKFNKKIDPLDTCCSHCPNGWQYPLQTISNAYFRVCSFWLWPQQTLFRWWTTLWSKWKYNKCLEINMFGWEEKSGGYFKVKLLVKRTIKSTTTKASAKDLISIKNRTIEKLVKENSSTIFTYIHQLSKKIQYCPNLSM